MSKRRPQRRPGLRSPTAEQPLETNADLIAAVLDKIDRQIEAGHPPEARATLDHLTTAGHSAEGARQLIAVSITRALIAAMQQDKLEPAEIWRLTLERLRNE
ncbi:MAG: hypothetical protein HC822_03575 [Oscillochloris sp.]|nr:hypothetical protein [Oscillochloris sp.]